nr:hypothetical protein [Synechococcus elongatus]
MSIPPAAPEPAPEVALAVVTQGRQYLLQLRDDLDWILYPGQWGLFGGHIEPGETLGKPCSANSKKKLAIRRRQRRFSGAKQNQL